MAGKALVRKQTYISRQQDAALKRIALRQKVTEAEIIRRAIDAYIKPLDAEANPLLELEGIGAGGSEDGAENHEPLLGVNRW